MADQGGAGAPPPPPPGGVRAALPWRGGLAAAPLGGGAGAPAAALVAGGGGAAAPGGGAGAQAAPDWRDALAEGVVSIFTDGVPAVLRGIQTYGGWAWGGIRRRWEAPPPTTSLITAADAFAAARAASADEPPVPRYIPSLTAAILEFMGEPAGTPMPYTLAVRLDEAGIQRRDVVAVGNPGFKLVGRRDRVTGEARLSAGWLLAQFYRENKREMNAAAHAARAGGAARDAWGARRDEARMNSVAALVTEAYFLFVYMDAEHEEAIRQTGLALRYIPQLQRARVGPLLARATSGFEQPSLNQSSRTRLGALFTVAEMDAFAALFVGGAPVFDDEQMLLPDGVPITRLLTIQVRALPSITRGQEGAAQRTYAAIERQQRAVFGGGAGLIQLPPPALPEGYRGRIVALRSADFRPVIAAAQPGVVAFSPSGVHALLDRIWEPALPAAAADSLGAAAEQAAGAAARPPAPAGGDAAAEEAAAQLLLDTGLAMRADRAIQLLREAAEPPRGLPAIAEGSGASGGGAGAYPGPMGAAALRAAGNGRGGVPASSWSAYPGAPPPGSIEAMLGPAGRAGLGLPPLSHRNLHAALGAGGGEGPAAARDPLQQAFAAGNRGLRENILRGVPRGIAEDFKAPDSSDDEEEGAGGGSFAGLARRANFVGARAPRDPRWGGGAAAQGAIPGLLGLGGAAPARRAGSAGAGAGAQSAPARRAVSAGDALPLGPAGSPNHFTGFGSAAPGSTAGSKRRAGAMGSSAGNAGASLKRQERGNGAGGGGAASPSGALSNSDEEDSNSNASGMGGGYRRRRSTHKRKHRTTHKRKANKKRASRHAKKHTRRH